MASGNEIRRTGRKLQAKPALWTCGRKWTKSNLQKSSIQIPFGSSR